MIKYEDNGQPQDYAKLAESGSEHAHQRAFFAWVNDLLVRKLHQHSWTVIGQHNLVYFDVYQLTYAVPNGASTGGDQKGRAIQGAKLKAEGLRPGVPDINVDVPVGTWHGLRIEMKKPKVGKVAKLQSRSKDALRRAGYVVAVCFSWEEAVQTYRMYLNGEI